MRPFVHRTLIWTTCVAVSSALMVVMAIIRGNLGMHWQSMSGAIQGVVLLIVFSIVSGAAIAGVGRFLVRFRGGREPEKDIINSIAEAALFPVLIFATILLLSSIQPTQ